MPRHGSLSTSSTRLRYLSLQTTPTWHSPQSVALSTFHGDSLMLIGLSSPTTLVYDLVVRCFRRRSRILLRARGLSATARPAHTSTKLSKYPKALDLSLVARTDDPCSLEYAVANSGMVSRDSLGKPTRALEFPVRSYHSSSLRQL